MKPATKRRLLRPFIEITRMSRKLRHELRTPEEIIDTRDKIHTDLMVADKNRVRDNNKVNELKFKEEILNWVLKENGAI